MKKLVIPMFAFLIISCGGNKTTEGDAAADSTKTETPEVAAGNPNIVDPLTYDFSKAISPQKLTESMNAYYAQEIQLIVYPEKYVDKEKFTQDQPAKASADAKDAGLTISFATVPDVEYTKGTAYIVKGTLADFRAGTWSPGGSFTLKKATLVGEAKDAKPAKLNLQAINTTDIYSLQDFLSSALAWEGKTVTIAGDYNGTTTSSDTKGKVINIRVDVSEPGNSSFMVGCEFDAEPNFQAGQKNISISGTLSSEMSFDRPSVKKCTAK